ncbi:hypothetical protein [Maricaulis maris]|jgi:hypothetical protein|uniref:hypothetical protein n=1 Tax=Maricaulis maris TaxID=74318 RepID=UPI0026F2E2B2|nr:hypothetical protein [Maricaulis maris]
MAISGIIAALATLQAGASVEPAGADINIRIIGRGTVECAIMTTDGNATRRARARASAYDAIRVDDALSAACTYGVSDGGELIIRFIETDGFACPFDAGIDEESCSTTIDGPAEGAFELVAN